MLPNAFVDKPKKPTGEELAVAPGSAKALWDQLVADLAAECGVAIQEWNSYSRKAGWSLRLKHKERIIVYLSPCRGCFRVAFAPGDKPAQAARRSKLPRGVLKMIAEAKRYPEGKAVRLDVKGPRDVAIVEKLARIKLEN